MDLAHSPNSLCDPLPASEDLGEGGVYSGHLTLLSLEPQFPYSEDLYVVPCHSAALSTQLSLGRAGTCPRPLNLQGSADLPTVWPVSPCLWEGWSEQESAPRVLGVDRS